MPFSPGPGLLAAALTASLALALIVWRFVRSDTSDVAVAGRETLYRLTRRGLVGGGAVVTVQDYARNMHPESQAELLRATSRLLADGVGFELICGDGGDVYLDISGFVRGAQAYVSVIDASVNEHRALARQGAAVAAADLAARQSDLLEHAPYLQWRMDGQGEILWSNADAMRRRGMPAEVPALLAAKAQRLKASDVPVQHRISIQTDTITLPLWFDVTLVPAQDGIILGYALAAERIMRAEAALGRFVETLTETFAHLPIGLAIFDRDRELGLFNPALADLLRLDPAWLAGRPTLSGFLNRLRERRTLPDQKDFRQWSEQLISLGRDGGTQEFAELWVQPSGRTLRVVGRPHPQGAVAFLLEDITPAVTLEQQFREGMTLRAAALESRPGTHLIFDISGAAGFVSTGFSKLTGVRSEREDLSTAGAVHEVLRQCRQAFGPAPIWDRVLSYVVGRLNQTERTPITVPLTRNGNVLSVLELNPLPGGGTLLSFLPTESIRATAVKTLREAVDLTLEQGRSVTEPADISIALVDRGAGDLPCTQQDLIRRAGYNMLLAAVDIVPPGQGATFTLSRQNGDALLTLSGEGANDESTIDGTLPISLLRRYLSDVRGEVTVENGARFTITARIPCDALNVQDADQPVLTRGAGAS
ncbi:PAS-domain containing protein [Pontivivens nitratireducens]|uniref:PAS domain-containing protein n=1 Tax=Pontivivens nitratireducens TaxID=2758038 RepID=A0A6G7VPG7_9RHOB|nr:PAS-domain containing protein [Pontibrevibacter nitratireducens]QIK41911.1 hypothetical protein G8E03_14770 [Pontibrevibacter nitratireducens]